MVSGNNDYLKQHSYWFLTGNISIFYLGTGQAWECSGTSGIKLFVQNLTKWYEIGSKMQKAAHE